MSGLRRIEKIVALGPRAVFRQFIAKDRYALAERMASYE
jgi:hypothetical protein